MYATGSVVDPTQAIDQGRKARAEGDFGAARGHYEEAAKIYRDQNNVLAYAHTIRHIADIYQQEANFVEAKPLYEKALMHYRNTPGTRVLDLANAIRPYALLSEAQGDHEAAKNLWEEARALYSSLGIDTGVAECDVHIGKLRQG